MELILRIKVSSRKEEELRAVIFLKRVAGIQLGPGILLTAGPLAGTERVAGLCCCDAFAKG
jgi:hypothetical protein